MTFRIPPWEAERIANVLEYAAMLTATEPKMKPWMKACSARIKAAVKAEKRRSETKRYCRTCKWLVGVKSIEPICVKHEIIVDPDSICCGQWSMWK